MTNNEHQPTFGELFLDELRQHMHTLPVNYAGVQRVRQMSQPELVKFVREHTGANYAQVQVIKQEQDPRALARFLADAQDAEGKRLAFVAIMMLG